MSQPPPHPDDYGEPYRGRPTAVTVLAIVGIVLGALGFLCRPIGFEMMYFVGRPNAYIERVRGDPTLFTWQIAATSMRWFLSTVLLVCSIGAMALKRWARQGLIGWAIATMLLALVELVMQFLVIQPKLTEIVASLPQTPSHRMSKAAAYGVPVIFGLFWPILMLVVMNAAHVKAAFAQGARPVI